MAELIKKRILLQHQTQVDLWWIFALSNVQSLFSLFPSISSISVSFSLSLSITFWKKIQDENGHQIHRELVINSNESFSRQHIMMQHHICRERNRDAQLCILLLYSTFVRIRERNKHDFKHFYLQQYYMVSYRNQWKISKNFFWWMHYT